MTKSVAEKGVAYAVATLRMEGMICSEAEKEIGMKMLLGEISKEEMQKQLLDLANREA